VSIPQRVFAALLVTFCSIATARAQTITINTAAPGTPFSTRSTRRSRSDAILSTYTTTDTRVYTTRDSKTGKLALWRLNFSNDNDATLDVALQGLSGNEKVQLLTLGALNGRTTLFSSNLASDMGGPTHEVDWRSADLTGTDLSYYQVTFHQRPSPSS
jgi:hypothetical protein